MSRPFLYNHASTYANNHSHRSGCSGHPAGKQDSRSPSVHEVIDFIAAVKENTSVHAPKINLKKDCVILFQGDSITDCGRDRNSNRCNTMEQFGSGYVLFTATQLLEGKAALQPKIYNRGISGNKVYQLRERSP